MVILETAFAGMKKTILFLAGISIMFVLFSGCIQENVLSEESGDESGNYTIYNYSTPGFEIDKEQASEVWEKVRFSDDAKFVTREKNFSVTVFVQRYAKGADDNLIYGSSTAEWIVVVSSIPDEAEDVKIAIFRLEYQTFGFKRSYYFSYPKVKEPTLQQSIAVMEEEMKKEPAMFQSINENAVVLNDGNFIFSYHSSNYGGERLLFSWDRDPIQHNGINGFLYSVGFNAITKFEKFDNNGTINAFSMAKSASLRLNDEKTRVYLELNDGSNAELIARMENDNLNIYGTTADTGATIIFNKYSGKTIFYATKAVFTEQTERINELSGKLIVPGEEVNGTTLLPGIETRFESLSSPAYRGTSTVAKLSFAANNNPPNGSEIKVDYKTEGLHADGSPQSANDGFSIIPEKKKLIFPGSEGQQIEYSNLTIKTSPKAAEGDYLITITSRYRGLVAGRIVLSFKIGKGGKKSGGKSMTEGSWNIGYSADNPLPLNMTEKEEMMTIALADPELKGRRYELKGVTSEFLDLENYSGFFAVVTVDVGDPDYTGEIIRYIVDREEKKIIGSSATPRNALEYFRGEAFDEEKGNFTKRWDAWNFPGLWLDNETNASTETLIIDQSLLNNSYRVIDKHNLIYSTKSITLNYEVYVNANRTPAGTNGYYSAIGWVGEKYVLLPEKKIAKIILEQNEFDESLMRPLETWNLGDGYSIFVNSVEIKAGVPQTWFILIRDGNKISDVILGPYIEKLYTYQIEQNSTPIVIVYFSGFKLDGAAFKYGWLRSQNTIEIKPGGIFGIMEVTSDNNGIIELRNRVPIELAPDRVINLMGNLNIKVGSSNTSLEFYPYRADEAGSTTLTGMLIITSTECDIPEGCGPKYQIWDSRFENFVPLLGNFTNDELEHIVRVKGVNTTLPASEYGKLGYRGPKEAVKVSSYSVLSKVQYHGFLVNEAGKYTAKKYPCLAFSNEYTSGAFFTKWNKAFAWEVHDNSAIIKVRMTNTSSSETPQPFYELWYDGSSGLFIKEIKYPDNADFCP